MGFKKIESKIGFAELALSSSMAKNRSLKTLEQMNKVIDWSKIESNLIKHYKIGVSNEGADAYPPLMLFKCLLLQKWFRIPSDPELGRWGRSSVYKFLIFLFRQEHLPQTHTDKHELFLGQDLQDNQDSVVVFPLSGRKGKRQSAFLTAK